MLMSKLYPRKGTFCALSVAVCLTFSNFALTNIFNIRTKQKTMIGLRLKLIALLVISMLTVDSVQGQNDGLLSLNDMMNGKYSQKRVKGMMPMADGNYYAVIEDNRVVRYSFATTKAAGIIFDLGEAKGEKPKSFSDYVASPDGNHLLIETNHKAIYRRSYTSDFYIYDVNSKQIQPLSTGGSQECVRFSPDGKLVGFVRGGNIFIVNVATMTETQITTDGKFNHIINGKPDWVYEEEFEFNCAYDFSADSHTVAWIRFDESAVKMFSFPLYRGANPRNDEYAVYTGSYEFKYPKAGEENSKVSVHTYNILTKQYQTVRVPLAADGYIPRIQFTYDKDKLAVVTLNRLQNRCDIYMANPHTGECRLTMSETNDKYVETSFYNNLDFSHDMFTVLSERDGWQHIYLYDIEGHLLRQLTKGNYMVRDFYGQSADGKYFYYSSSEGNPLESFVCRVDRKGNTTCLTPRHGVNAATFSSGCKYFINAWSDMNHPTVYTLCDAKGKELKVLEDNRDLTNMMGMLKLGKAELFRFTTSEGVELNGWMVKPHDFDASKKYPVLMFQYSGPGNQQVMNRWGNGQFGGLLWEHRLSQKGYIIACVDGRGTGGRGSEWQRCTYRRLGALESKDQVETALYLGSLPYIDKERIAIWGWSYGGWNTLMSMSEGRPVFNCGVAVAPVTSYRYYDSAYTERYMGLPQDNAGGYDDNPMSRADKLHGDVLLVHGYADDNVHFQNMAELTEVYVQRGIQFESQFYVNRNHGISGGNTRRHLFTRIEAFLDSHLLE